jgi:hypothetical protein
MAQCTNCGTQPRPKDGRRLTCVPCDRLIKQTEQEARARKPRSAGNYSQYFRLIKWKGHLVGAKLRTGGTPRYELSHCEDHLVACTPVGREPIKGAYLVYIEPVADAEGLPKEKLIDLDQWLEGYSAEMVRVLKINFRKAIPHQKVRQVEAEE